MGSAHWAWAHMVHCICVFVYLYICVFAYLRICVFAYLLNLYLLKCEMCRIWRLVWQMRTHGTLKGFLQQFPEIFTCSTAGRSQSIATLLMQSNSKKYTDTNTNTQIQIQIHKFSYSTSIAPAEADKSEISSLNSCRGGVCLDSFSNVPYVAQNQKKFHCRFTFYPG